MKRQQPAVIVRNLTKRFRDVVALSNLDLEVAEGEAVALIGQNGAGKSTLLRILGTSVLPDSGWAAVAGHDVVAAGPKARSSIGFLLPDERSWYWRLTGRQNLEFFSALHGLSRRDARVHVEELLDAVGLNDAADRRFDGYSSGMRLRLSLARALVAQPAVLLLDEPTRSIDPVTRPHLQELVADFVRTRRLGALLATHDLDEASRLAARCVFLHNGRIAGTAHTWRDGSDLRTQLNAALS